MIPRPPSNTEKKRFPMGNREIRGGCRIAGVACNKAIRGIINITPGGRRIEKTGIVGRGSDECG